MFSAVSSLGSAVERFFICILKLSTSATPTLASLAFISCKSLSTSLTSGVLEEGAQTVVEVGERSGALPPNLERQHGTP